ncbi:MAG: hypothetical protein ACR2QK_17465 [Acidimicrobiales bacterium]
MLASAVGAPIGLLDRHAQERRIRNRRVLGRVARRVVGRDFRLPATRSTPSVEGSDHVFFMAHGPWDLPLLERLRSLRSPGVTVSVWMPEVWPGDLSDPRIEYECYSMIDHVFVGIHEAVEPFTEIVPSAQVHFLPPAVDVMRFAPVDPFADRPISVLGIGRRDPEQHRELVDWARTRQALYLYDTVEGRAIDWEEHRNALANWYQHSNALICNFAKHNMPSETGDLRTMPGRLFEGLGAGAILIGRPPDEESQRRVLGTTVVEPLGDSPRPLTELLDRFLDPAQAQAIRVRNLTLACRGHDWGHRWRTAYEAVGLEVPFGLQNRLDDLAKKADEYEELAASR